LRWTTTAVATRLATFAFLLPLQAFAGDYDDIVRAAIDALDDDYHEQWAFTETSVESELTTVARYNPGGLASQPWTLLSINGGEPDAEETADFLESKADEFAEDDKDDDSKDGIEQMINPGSLLLLDETDSHLLFSFIPSEDEFEAGFAEHVNGTIKIAKGVPYVEFINLENSEVFKPQFGVKISEFQTRLKFAPAALDGPIVPTSINVRIKARAFLAIKVDETISYSYTDYRYVGD
jgi:hypothetical protein